MSENFLPFALPEIGDEEINEVVDSLRSGWITTGPKAKRFEEDFSRFLGDENLHSIAVNSATSGLHLALEALGVGPDDEVIIPSYTFTATAEVVRYLGATPVFVDVEASTFNIDPKAFESAITARTKVVIPVHFAGLACNMTEILRIAYNHNIKVVEDAAHALPCKHNGEMIGTLKSDVTVFSFYANKTMTTAEGGMLVTANDDIAKRAKIMRLHGISRDAFDRYTSNKPSWSYEIVAPGCKYNMPDICAAIGIHQLKKLPSFLQKRELLAENYNEALNALPVILPPQPEAGSTHSWHLYPIRLKPDCGVSRDQFIERMAQLGVGCSVHFIPLHLQPYWRDTFNLEERDFPVSQALFEGEVSLPLYTKMTLEDQRKVIEAVNKVLNNG
ncbi:DegT/DnrJ/EryC1/StrS family aminotransferase [Pseudoalteromonas sp. SR41-8]|uniref:DegT/DnrJ/EryC1/StrS family aminotransferase n=1 Tax=Pseudoalteromonas sp. SR41-8 TaxID=2760946 RepID=UPI0016044836|nr:DegT/DnrJ/EryC1/StrS family aminotransferase [Pseudoalteromonas sp. SR41-8]MBB1311785.1 DegT/DnrJ/EryC1/StrS family aminotransferase [Pseudoalteromonas sp. SR41-8]